MPKKIVLIIPFKIFRDEEYAEPKEVFEKGGYTTVTASSKPGIAEGKLGMRVAVDITLEQVRVDEYAAILFIGGGGCAEYFHSSLAHRIAQDAVKQGKILGALCAAPEILANAGVLKGKRATMYDDTGCFAKHGAVYTGNDVEIDGNIITATGPRTARSWAQEILRKLVCMQ